MQNKTKLLLSLITVFGSSLYYHKIYKKYKNPLYKFQLQVNYVQLGKYYTQFLQKSVQLQNNDSDKSTKIVIFSGNPSSVFFYDKFASILFQELNQKFEIFCVAQAGQFSHKNKPWNKSLFTLEEEAEHKFLFLQHLQKKYPNSNFILIAHSIGCHLTLQNLKKLHENQINIKQVFLLFPAIEQLLESPNGKFSKYAPYFGIRHLLSLVYLILQLMPTPLKRCISKRQTMIDNQSNDDLAEAAIIWAKYNNFLNMLYMTYYEYRDIKEIDYKKIEQYKDKIILYYGKKDDWVPLKFYENMKKQFPQITYLDELGLEHAFVMNGSQKMAKFLKDKIDLLD